MLFIGRAQVDRRAHPQVAVFRGVIAGAGGGFDLIAVGIFDAHHRSVAGYGGVGRLAGLCVHIRHRTVDFGIHALRLYGKDRFTGGEKLSRPHAEGGQQAAGGGRQHNGVQPLHRGGQDQCFGGLC